MRVVLLTTQKHVLCWGKHNRESTAHCNNILQQIDVLQQAARKSLLMMQQSAGSGAMPSFLHRATRFFTVAIVSPWFAFKICTHCNVAISLAGGDQKMRHEDLACLHCQDTAVVDLCHNCEYVIPADMRLVCTNPSTFDGQLGWHRCGRHLVAQSRRASCH